MTTSTLVIGELTETLSTLLQSSIKTFLEETTTKTTSTTLTTSTSFTKVPIEPKFKVMKTSQMTMKAFDYEDELKTSTTTTATTRKDYPTRPVKKTNFSQTNLILSLLISFYLCRLFY